MHSGHTGLVEYPEKNSYHRNLTAELSCWEQGTKKAVRFFHNYILFTNGTLHPTSSVVKKPDKVLLLYFPH